MAHRAGRGIFRAGSPDGGRGRGARFNGNEVKMKETRIYRELRGLREMREPRYSKNAMPEKH